MHTSKYMASFAASKLNKFKMKSIKFYLIALLGLGVFFTACNPDDVNPVDVVTEDDYKIGTTVYTVDKATVTVSIKDLGAGFGGNYSMSADTTYVLDGLVFVNDGQTLTIEAGTMVQGKPGQGENASALVVARGGKIKAEGTASSPIVFTGLGDNFEGSVYGTNVRGLWGGIIVLGKATTNNLVDQQIEGIPETESRGLYGGTNDADNSGVLKYVSIRHGGTDIGAGNEINGLTLGAVGNATVIEYVEIISNIDDGIEFFGGAPSVKYAVVAYCGDDSYDYDQGFHGKGQFWFAVQDDVVGDYSAEQDGGPSDNEAGTPYAMPVIYNATYVNNGTKIMVFRDNAGGTYANSVFAYAEVGVKVEFRNDKGSSSYDMFLNGNLMLKNNIFVDVDALIGYYNEKGTAPADAQTKLESHFTSNGNTSDDDLFGEAFVPATGKANAGVAASDNWFSPVTFQGAFDPSGTNWTAGWTLYSRSK